MLSLELSVLYQLTFSLLSFQLTFGTLPSELREPVFNQSHPFSPAAFNKTACVILASAVGRYYSEFHYSLRLIKQFQTMANRYPVV